MSSPFAYISTAARTEPDHLMSPVHAAGAPGDEGHSYLGLMVAKRIVGDHGGSLQVESALGKGTEFRIHLP